jgi:hypothetical protein
MISGYGVEEAPGAAFDYSDWNIKLWFDTLVTQVYDTTLASVNTDVFRPLGEVVADIKQEGRRLVFWKRKSVQCRPHRGGRVRLNPGWNQFDVIGARCCLLIPVG